MHNDDAIPPAVDALVDAMLQSSGQLALILAQMESYPYSSPDADPPPDVLRRLMSDILAQLPERHGLDDVATAAQMLAAATDLVGEDLFYVPPNRAERRATRRGRRRRR